MQGIAEHAPKIARKRFMAPPRDFEVPVCPVIVLSPCLPNAQAQRPGASNASLRSAEA